jgi:hypothetical protein
MTPISSILAKILVTWDGVVFYMFNEDEFVLLSNIISLGSEYFNLDFMFLLQAS